MKIFLLIVCLALAGCDLDPQINNLHRPLVIVAINENGMILRDKNGTVVVYSGESTTTKIAFKQGMKQGDVFCP